MKQRLIFVLFALSLFVALPAAAFALQVAICEGEACAGSGIYGSYTIVFDADQ